MWVPPMSMARIDAPTAFSAGWLEGGFGPPVWSDDGKAVFLPGAFAMVNGNEQNRPCLAVFQTDSDSTNCLRPLHRNLQHGFEAGYQQIATAQFVGNGHSHLVL